MSVPETDISSQLKYPVNKRIILPIAVGATGLIIMGYIGYLLQRGHLAMLQISEYKLVNFTFTMQAYVLPLSLSGILFLFFYNRNSFYTFFRFTLKDRQDPTGWHKSGPLMLVGFAIVTAAFLSINVLANNGTINLTFWKLFPLVVLFSATNAWTEEILSRFVIVGGLYRKLPPNSIYWISAVVFGLPHFFSSNGLLGVMMAGLMGWLLAKSVLETKSLGWALLIHFVLDIIVFGAGAMILAGST
jgi:uncharacterized protein